VIEQGAALDDEVLVQRAITLDSGSDIARVDVCVLVDQSRGLVGGEELRDDVAIVTVAHDRVVDRVAAGLQHLVDEAVDLGQRFGRGRLEVLLELLPPTLPLVFVQSRLEHRLLRSHSGTLSNPSARLVTVPV